MLKKLLILTLMFSLIYGMNTDMSSALCWRKENLQSPENVCEKINKCGQYKDINCAIAEGIEILKAKLDNNVDFRKAGQNCEYDLRIWNYLSLKDFYLSMGTDLQRAKEGVAFNEILRNVTSSIKSIFDTDDEISEKIALYWSANSRFINLNRENINVEKTAKDKKNNKKKWTGGIGTIGLIGAGIAAWCFPPAGIAVLGHALLTGVSAATGGVVTAVITDAVMSTVQSSNEFKESQKSLIGVRNYASVIESLLNHVENGDWEQADSVLAKINSAPETYGGVVSMLNSQISYSREQKAAFEKMFKKLEDKLKNILNIHKSEGWS